MPVSDYQLSQKLINEVYVRMSSNNVGDCKPPQESVMELEPANNAMKMNNMWKQVVASLGWLVRIISDKNTTLNVVGGSLLSSFMT